MASRAGWSVAHSAVLRAHPMRTLRQVSGRVHGAIQAIPLRLNAQWGISVILGAYLSLRLVAPGQMSG
jgi:hypothetical protein